jgi:lipoprotein-releasing system permease protein
MISLRIAVRFLKSGRTQTILIVFGIAVAISIQLFVGLLIESLQKTLVDRTIGNAPQITITSATDITTIRDWQLIVERIKLNEGITAITVSATGNAFVENGNRNLPVVVRGFDFDGADAIYHFSDSIYDGRRYESPREVLVGKELGEELGLKVGDRLAVTLPNGIAGTFTVSGLYDLGVGSINRTWLLGNLATAQGLFNYRDRVTSIEMTVKSVFDADRIAGEIERQLGNGNLKIENWKEANQELLSGLEGQRMSSIIIQAVIIISVVVAISSVLAITVLQKSREIGILKAMGMKDLPASLIFIYQGLLVGILGSTLGVALGLGLLYGFNSFTVRPDGSSLVDLYTDYNFVARSWFIALLASTLAGILPAWKSQRLTPVEVIREG